MHRPLLFQRPHLQKYKHVIGGRVIIIFGRSLKVIAWNNVSFISSCCMKFGRHHDWFHYVENTLVSIAKLGCVWRMYWHDVVMTSSKSLDDSIIFFIVGSLNVQLILKCRFKSNSNYSHTCFFVAFFLFQIFSKFHNIFISEYVSKFTGTAYRLVG